MNGGGETNLITQPALMEGALSCVEPTHSDFLWKRTVWKVGKRVM